MSTPSDGLRPRMQMFVWSGDQQAATLTLTPGGNRRRSAPRRSGRPTSTSRRRSRSPTTAPAPSPPTRCDAARGLSGRPDRARRPRHVHLRRQGANAQAAGGVGIIIANNVAGAGSRPGRRRPDRHDRRPVDQPGRRRRAEGRARGRAGDRPHVPAHRRRARRRSTTRSSRTSGATTCTTGSPTAASQQCGAHERGLGRLRRDAHDRRARATTWTARSRLATYAGAASIRTARTSASGACRTRSTSRRTR